MYIRILFAEFFFQYACNIIFFQPLAQHGNELEIICLILGVLTPLLNTAFGLFSVGQFFIQLRLGSSAPAQAGM